MTLKILLDNARPGHPYDVSHAQILSNKNVKHKEISGVLKIRFHLVTQFSIDYTVGIYDRKILGDLKFG